MALSSENEPNEQARKKYRMVGSDCHVGESIEGSTAFDFSVRGFQPKELVQCLAVDCHGGESIEGSIVLPPLKRRFDDIDQPGKKCKRVVDSHVGESINRSPALDIYASGSRSQNLSHSFVVEYDMSISSDPSPVINFCATGFQLEEFIQRVQEMILVVQELAPEIAVDWSVLEDDVLVRIAENHLLSFDDFTVFSSVSRSWHRAAASCNPIKLNKKWIHNQMPWLMLTDGNTKTDKEGYSNSDYVLPRVLNDIEEFDIDTDVAKIRNSRREHYTRDVLNLRSNKGIEIIIPEGYGRVCWGSAHGWIVTAGGDGKMFMFDPVTKSRVGLPSFGTFRCRWENEDKLGGHDCGI